MCSSGTHVNIRFLTVSWGLFFHTWTNTADQKCHIFSVFKWDNKNLNKEVASHPFLLTPMGPYLFFNKMLILWDVCAVLYFALSCCVFLFEQTDTDAAMSVKLFFSSVCVCCTVLSFSFCKCPQLLFNTVYNTVAIADVCLGGRYTANLLTYLYRRDSALLPEVWENTRTHT